MRLKNRNQEAPLSPAVVATVLGGWGTTSSLGDDDGLFDLYMSRQTGVVALWAEHEAFLRAEARRLKITPDFEMPDGRVLFFAEFVSRPQAEQMEYWQLRGEEALTDDEEL